MTILAKIPSDSNPNKVYEIRKGSDGEVYCTCPAWAFSAKRNGGVHDCKHLRRMRDVAKAMAARVKAYVQEAK